MAQPNPRPVPQPLLCPPLCTCTRHDHDSDLPQGPLAARRRARRGGNPGMGRLGCVHHAWPLVCGAGGEVCLCGFFGSLIHSPRNSVAAVDGGGRGADFERVRQAHLPPRVQPPGAGMVCACVSPCHSSSLNRHVPLVARQASHPIHPCGADPPPAPSPSPTNRFMHDQLGINMWNFDASAPYRWSNHQARCFFNASLSSADYFQETILGASSSSSLSSTTALHPFASSFLHETRRYWFHPLHPLHWTPRCLTNTPPIPLAHVARRHPAPLQQVPPHAVLPPGPPRVALDAPHREVPRLGGGVDGKVVCPVSMHRLVRGADGDWSRPTQQPPPNHFFHQVMRGYIDHVAEVSNT